MYDAGMRTTIDVDEDVLQAAKEIAANRRTTAGRVISELARKGLQPSEPAETRNGIPLMPRRPAGTARPSLETVNRLRDEP